MNIYTRWTVEGKWLSEPPVGMKFVASHKGVEFYRLPVDEPDYYQEGYQEGYKQGFEAGRKALNPWTPMTRLIGAREEGFRMGHAMGLEEGKRESAEAYANASSSLRAESFREGEAFALRQVKAIPRKEAIDLGGSFWKVGYNCALDDVIAKLSPKKENN